MGHGATRALQSSTPTPPPPLRPRVRCRDRGRGCGRGARCGAGFGRARCRGAAQRALLGDGGRRRWRVEDRPEQRVRRGAREPNERARDARQLVAVLGVQVSREHDRHVLRVVLPGEREQVAEDDAVLEAARVLLLGRLGVAREVRRGDEQPRARVAPPAQQREQA
eukprot:7078357-Prymnesium_polylepis.1